MLSDKCEFSKEGASNTWQAVGVLEAGLEKRRYGTCHSVAFDAAVLLREDARGPIGARKFIDMKNELIISR